MDREDIIITGVIAGTVSLLVAIFALIVYSGIVEHREWESFALSHHCKITSKVIGVESNQTGWTCDDGITYYRED